MATIYSWAIEDVGPMAAELVEQHHPHLAGVRVDYVWRSPAARNGGKLTLGKARKISGLQVLLARADGDFFVVELAGDEWLELTEHQRRALVDHELTHCFVDAEGKFSILPHDVEEFEAIVRRHGTWSPDLMGFAEALQVDA